jgi:hypothetical protein
MKPIVFILAFFALLIPGGNSTQDTGQETGTVEQLLGLQVGPEGVIFQVFSGGCTTKDDFRIERFQADPVQLLLIRLEPDTCEAFIPYGTTIRYSYESLELENGQRFIVLNPMTPIKVVKESQP